MELVVVRDKPAVCRKIAGPHRFVTMGFTVITGHVLLTPVFVGDPGGVVVRPVVGVRCLSVAASVMRATSAPLGRVRWIVPAPV